MNTKKKKTIDFEILAKTYPGFIFIAKVAELCGYNPKIRQYLVIDDGMCCNNTGTWLVNLYKITNPAYNPFDECKYPCEETDGVKIAEHRVCLSSANKANRNGKTF